VRLSDADRDGLIQQLAEHSAAGRLSVEELERRVEAVCGAVTHEEAAAILADLPPLPGPSQRTRRHGETAAPEPDWQPTSERFRDPRSGRITRVWVDSVGARHYVSK
jgi:hypothetical protein